MKAIADRLVDDDSKQILSVLDEEVQELALEFMLCETELEEFGKHVRKILTPTWLRLAFKLSKKGKDLPKLRYSIRETFEPILEAIASSRPTIELPQPEEVAPHVIEIAELLDAA